MNFRDVNIGDSRVLESRLVGDGRAIRRRRETLDGKFRFTTYERIDKQNIVVIKKNGNREIFDRTKLMHSITNSVGNFFPSNIEVENIVNNIEDVIYDFGLTEIPSSKIGDAALHVLENASEVAYVRFASVYYDFKTLSEFEKILKDRKEEKDQEDEKI